jgi:hypothetical protein
LNVLPTGTVTFLFTDIEGSTQRWDDHPEAMRAALEKHDALMRIAAAIPEADRRMALLHGRRRLRGRIARA